MRLQQESSSRASSLHAELPCVDILHMFQLLKQRRNDIQEKRALIFQSNMDDQTAQVDNNSTPRMLKRKADVEDPVWTIKQAKKEEFSRLFSDNVVPSPLVM
ncbi:unnamed protein product [Aphanomyces euteiches]|nr:hypothetical protein AeRB84_003321 [Aphanomyces euteiches]